MPSAEELRASLPVHERLDDLLGASMGNSPKPYRVIEWVGQASPLDDPLVQWNFIHKRYTPEQEKAIRRAAARARTRGDGPTFRTRLLEHDHQHAQAVFKGLSRSYIFSHANGYIQLMEYRDVDVLFSSNIAHEFRDLDDPSTDKRPLIRPPSRLERIVFEDRVRNGEAPPRGVKIATH